MSDQLHVRDLIELAGLVAVESSTLMSNGNRISRTGLESYWSASKFRFDRWGVALRKYQREINHIGPSWAGREWPLIVPILEEVFASEILTRVWCAVLSAHDNKQGQQEMEPTGHTIVVGHMESRNRALKLVADCPENHASQGLAVDELLRRCQRRRVQRTHHRRPAAHHPRRQHRQTIPRPAHRTLPRIVRAMAKVTIGEGLLRRNSPRLFS